MGEKLGAVRRKALIRAVIRLAIALVVGAAAALLTMQTVHAPRVPANASEDTDPGLIP